MPASDVLFLSWEAPWPAHSGAALRSLGFLKQLNRAFSVDLLVVSRMELRQDQRQVLSKLGRSLWRVPMDDFRVRRRVEASSRMICLRIPYHSALLNAILHSNPAIRDLIENFQGVVLTSQGHWGSLVLQGSAKNWILNQCDADIDFWRVYARECDNNAVRLLARLNYLLARRQFPRIYNNVARVISVCDQDRQLTLSVAPEADVHVIPNGVDCCYMRPTEPRSARPARLLFTGTCAPRNKSALHHFMRDIYATIKEKVPETELLVAGNFSKRAQREFAAYPVPPRFTGMVPDIRPCFDISQVFIAPFFGEAYGSKLKISEAMAMGMAIFSSISGVRGLPLRNGESVLIARDEKEFGALTCQLLLDHQLRRRLGEAAREIAVNELDWMVLGGRLNDIVSRTAAGQGR